MRERICLIGLEESESTELARGIDGPVLAHEMLPRIVVDAGKLLVENNSGSAYLPVSRVVFHGIFAEDLETLCGLALWGGPCLPSAHGMVECRLKFPSLVKALSYSRFAEPRRGFASRGAEFVATQPHVAKWGNWHCGENKARFSDRWTGDEHCVVEPFLAGDSVRVVAIGEQTWQIRLAGETWLKSIHAPDAEFMPPCPELVADTLAVRRGLGLEILANDYIVTPAGTSHLLEANQIPNVTRFPAIWVAYRDFVWNWLATANP